jgi:hypothetical protein
MSDFNSESFDSGALFLLNANPDPNPNPNPNLNHTSNRLGRFFRFKDEDMHTKEFFQRWMVKWCPQLRLLYILFVDLPTGGDGLPLRDTCNTVLGMSIVLEQECRSLQERHVSGWG